MGMRLLIYEFHVYPPQLNRHILSYDFVCLCVTVWAWGTTLTLKVK